MQRRCVRSHKRSQRRGEGAIPPRCPKIHFKNCAQFNSLFFLPRSLLGRFTAAIKACLGSGVPQDECSQDKFLATPKSGVWHALRVRLWRQLCLVGASFGLCIMRRIWKKALRRCNRKPTRTWQTCCFMHATQKSVFRSGSFACHF